jgi:EPS-associated MarR family transcriptional regulator
MSPQISDDVRYRLLRYLSAHPEASQRELARELGVSVGKLNYCLHALMEKGLVKARNFKRSKNKSAYAYVLTPRGIEEKVEVTAAFLRRKLAEHELLVQEIASLRSEVRAAAKPEMELEPES